MVLPRGYIYLRFDGTALRHVYWELNCRTESQTAKWVERLQAIRMHPVQTKRGKFYRIRITKEDEIYAIGEQLEFPNNKWNIFKNWYTSVRFLDEPKLK